MANVTEAQKIIDVLRKLQAIDDEIRDVREGRDAMTGNFARLNRVLTTRDGQLVEMRGKLAEAETWFTKKSFELENEKEKLLKAKTKLSGVTRSKEYVAVNREMDNIRKNLANREDEVQRLTVAIEEFRSTIQREDDKVKEMRKVADAEALGNEAALGEMNATIDDAEARRGAVAEKLSGGIVRRYSRIFKAREGVAVTSLIDGVCSGCNMVLQPRFVEQLLRGSSIVQCPHCSRYLFDGSSHDEEGNAIAGS